MRRIFTIKERGRVLLFAALGTALLSSLLVSCGGYGGGGGTAPMSFMLASPGNGDAVSTTPTLRWTAAAGATSYAVQVDVENTFTLPRVIDVTVNTTTYTITTPLAPGAYHWRVIANNYYGTVTAGPSSFTVQ